MEPSIPAPGSDFYYASLYVPTLARSQLALINSFKTELCAIPLKVSDVGVARIKLEWWHNEVTHLNAGEPRHELSKAYHAAYGVDLEFGDAISALLAGLDEELGGRRLQDRAAQRAWFDKTFGDLYAFQAAILGERDADDIALCRALGREIEISNSLLHLRPLLTKRLRRLPDQNLREAACTWDDLESGVGSVAIVNFLNGETQHAVDQITAHGATTTRSFRRRLGFFYTMALLSAQALVEMRNDGYQYWQYRVELTPLRKLWVAWRTRFF